MFVTAADLNQRRLKVFYSGDTEDGALNLWEVLRTAVAAETYFLPWCGMADGGIYAQNPSMVGVAGACDVFDCKLEDIAICSIGTGDHSNNNNIGSTHCWTFLQWGMYIIEAELAGAANTMHEFFISRLPLRKYLRVQFNRLAGWNMDDTSCVKAALTEWAPFIAKGVQDVANF
jgi:patatin-like phospholipase/acyl hydrolase